MSSDWIKISRKKKEKIRIKEKITFLCVQTGTQIPRSEIEKNKEIENQKDNEEKTPQNNPTSLSATALTFQPLNSPIKQSTKHPVRHIQKEQRKQM